jgi:hypothetical protein
MRTSVIPVKTISFERNRNSPFTKNEDLVNVAYG